MTFLMTFVKNRLASKGKTPKIPETIDFSEITHAALIKLQPRYAERNERNFLGSGVVFI
jgi:hypothetical protein